MATLQLLNIVTIKNASARTRKVDQLSDIMLKPALSPTQAAEAKAGDVWYVVQTADDKLIACTLSDRETTPGEAIVGELIGLYSAK